MHLQLVIRGIQCFNKNGFVKAQLFFIHFFGVESEIPAASILYPKNGFGAKFADTSEGHACIHDFCSEKVVKVLMFRLRFRLSTKKRKIIEVKKLVDQNCKHRCNEDNNDKQKKRIIRHFALPPLRVYPRRYQGKVQA
nr:MAG TPA: hypothetical protein [Caudoviricetes sp.]